MIKTAGIIGAGTMGIGIAFQLLTHQVTVILNGHRQVTLDTVKDKLVAYLQEFRQAGFTFHEDDATILGRLQLTTTIEDLADYDLVIEVVPEDLALKQNIFKKLDTICKPETILASNTSSLSLAKIVEAVEKHKERLLLIHFFNPAHIVPLVELLKTTHTTQAVLDEVRQFLDDADKVTIEVKKDLPGLVANRIQAALVRESLALLEDDVVSKADLEKAISAGLGFRLASSGMLSIMDYGGLDVWRAVMEQLQPVIESGVRPFPSLADKVKVGNLGVKTGAGFFDYSNQATNELELSRNRALLHQLKNINNPQEL